MKKTRVRINCLGIKEDENIGVETVKPKILTKIRRNTGKMDLK